MTIKGRAGMTIKAGGDEIKTGGIKLNFDQPIKKGTDLQDLFPIN